MPSIRQIWKQVRCLGSCEKHEEQTWGALDPKLGVSGDFRIAEMPERCDESLLHLVLVDLELVERDFGLDEPNNRSNDGGS